MSASSAGGVFAVQCPNPKCRKYMLVEEHDRDKVVPCLLCKTPIRCGGAPARSSRPTPPPQPPA
jgi:hypothetical protein